MSTVATKAISAKLFTGTFDLRNHLVDNTTEEIANNIIAEVNTAIESYRVRNAFRSFTPLFAFGGVEGDPAKIDLYVMVPGTPNIQAATINLKWKKIGNSEILVIRKTTRTARVEHMNASFTFSELKTALSIRNVSVHDSRNELLSHHLGYYETMHRKHPTEFSFDLELNDEGVTVVAYRDFKRHSAITAFAQN